jgi:hypothetical protein
MSTDCLTSEYYAIYAMKNYYIKDNLNVDEFRLSLKTITYINKLLNKDDDANHRLILNHIIIASNTFSTRAVVRMLFFKLSEQKYCKIKTYLHFLRYLPKTEYCRDDKGDIHKCIPEVDINSIDIDEQLLETLNNL